MKRVIDSCVVLKWLLCDRPEEAHVASAFEILHRVQEGVDEVIQPVHWCAEVLSVTTRLEPDLVDSAVDLLDLLAFNVASDWAVYRRAAALSVQLNHHLFDTLYHAVAFEYNAEFVTADRKYFEKARGLGAIRLLG